MLAKLATATVLVYLGFGILIYLAQRSIMYLPVAERHAVDVTAEYLSNGDVSLKLWVVSPGQDAALIYFGGNAEDVYWNAADFRTALPGHTVYLVNYRGYGGSSGSPSERGLFSDALKIYDTLAVRHGPIDVVGRSLGSGVAVYLASERPLRRLVLVTPHDSMVSMARRMYPIYPVSLLLKDRYESVEYAPRVRAPTLIVTAARDRIIPLEHATRLVQAFAPGVARQLAISGAGHNDLSLSSEYWAQLAAFVR